MNQGTFLRSPIAFATATALILGVSVYSGGALAQSVPSPAPPSTAPGNETAPPDSNLVKMPAQQSAAATTAPAKADPRVEAHIARLHDQLKITPAETAQWNAVAQVMRDNAQHLSTLVAQRTKGQKSMSAVDNLRDYQAITDAHADGLKKLVPAFSALYASMSDAQKKTADHLFNQRVTQRVRQTTPSAKSTGTSSTGKANGTNG